MKMNPLKPKELGFIVGRNVVFIRIVGKFDNTLKPRLVKDLFLELFELVGVFCAKFKCWVDFKLAKETRFIKKIDKIPLFLVFFLNFLIKKKILLYFYQILQFLINFLIFS